MEMYCFGVKVVKEKYFLFNPFAVLIALVIEIMMPSMLVGNGRIVAIVLLSLSIVIAITNQISFLTEFKIFGKIVMCAINAVFSYQWFIIVGKIVTVIADNMGANLAYTNYPNVWLAISYINYIMLFPIIMVSINNLKLRGVSIIGHLRLIVLYLVGIFILNVLSVFILSLIFG